MPAKTHGGDPSIIKANCRKGARADYVPEGAIAWQELVE